MATTIREDVNISSLSTRLYLLEEKLKALPPGAPGEAPDFEPFNATVLRM